MLELRGHSGPVVGLAYSPDGQLLASASADGTARVWIVRTGEHMVPMSSTEARAYCVAFSQDGMQLAVGYGGDRGVAQLWDLESIRRIDTWSAHHRVCRGVAFQGPYLWTCGDSSRGSPMCSWEVPSITQHFGKNDRGGGTVRSFAFAPDQSRFVALGGVGIAFFEIRKTVLPPRYSINLNGIRGGSGHCLAISPIERIAACGLDGIVVCAKPERHASPKQLFFRRGPLPHHWPAHDGAVLGVAFLPDGQSLLSAATDGLVKHWSLDGRLLHTIDWQIGELGAVAIAPDGLTAAVGGAEKIVVWDLDQ